MTAGKGIVHSEMPATPNENTGLQLWVNLARDQKMIDPAYQELPATKVPKATGDNNKGKDSGILPCELQLP